MSIRDWYLSVVKIKGPGVELELRRISEKEIGATGNRSQAQRVALQAFNGLYVSAKLHEGKELIADRSICEAWEIFELIRLSDGKFALRAYNNQFVSAKLHQAAELIADRDEVHGWESFTLSYLPDGKVALQAFNGMYVSAKLHERCQLTADRADVQGWECFTLLHVE